MVHRIATVERDAAAHHVEMAGGLAQGRRAVGGVDAEAPEAALAARRRTARTPRAGRRRTPGRRRRWRSGSSPPRASARGRRATGSATASASSASRVPSRPMPLSSLTWTPTGAAPPASRTATARAATKLGFQATTSAPAASATGSSSALIAPITSTGALSPAARSSAASPAVATARRVGAAGQRRPGHRHRAVARGVGLDHRAQLGAAGQPCSQRDDVALDRGQVDAGQRAQGHGQILSEGATTSWPDR